jgi:hypothetical protein
LRGGGRELKEGRPRREVERLREAVAHDEIGEGRLRRVADFDAVGHHVADLGALAVGGLLDFERLRLEHGDVQGDGREVRERDRAVGQREAADLGERLIVDGARSRGVEAGGVGGLDGQLDHARAVAARGDVEVVGGGRARGAELCGREGEAESPARGRGEGVRVRLVGREADAGGGRERRVGGLSGEQRDARAADRRRAAAAAGEDHPEGVDDGGRGRRVGARDVLARDGGDVDRAAPGVNPGRHPRAEREGH